MRKIKEESLDITNENSNEFVRITLTINPILLSQVTNYVKNLNEQGDFTFESFSDFVRKALLAVYEGRLILDYKNIPSKSNKKEIGVRLSPALYEYYSSLPKGKKSLVVNLAIKHFLEEQK